LRDPADLQVGQRAIFYTQSWLYGKGLALRALGYGPVPGVAAGQGAGAGEPVQALIDRDRQARADSADLIIRGTVVSVRAPAETSEVGAAAQPLGAKKRGRHDPLWQVATIRVTGVESGASPPGGAPQTVEVWFPGADDVAWHAYPKFHVGQQGRFILRKTSLGALAPAPGAGERDQALAGAEVYTAPHPLDFQPAHELGETPGGGAPSPMPGTP
jgi:hypothetical protein